MHECRTPLGWVRNEERRQAWGNAERLFILFPFFTFAFQQTYFISKDTRAHKHTHTHTHT